ncbi:MBL fold metallo-hydrolase [Acidothermaceae bacterium B102]|nr:MBL fold metallo-hydrolase [Acidothermaceae bacterium B102]
MAYTGDVTPEAPIQRREVAGLSITKLLVGGYGNNAYLLRCTRTGEALLIDAAADGPALLREIDTSGGDLARVVTTHQHGDHWAALEAVVGVTQAAVVVHPLDADELPLAADELVSEGARIPIGATSVEVIHLVGHTPGGIALLYDAEGEIAGAPHLFTGDSLFPGGVGNTWKDPERFAQLLGDVEAKIFNRLPDETWVYPGHGGDTTLGAERPHLAEWRERGW